MLTQIPRISRNFSFDDVKSHGGFGRGRLTQIPLACFRAHTDPTDLTEFFLLMMLNLTEVSGVGVWLTQIPLACFRAHTDPTNIGAMLTRIPRISRNFFFDDVKSHGGFCI